MQTLHKKRLLKLADFLDELPEERFNFRHWVGHHWAGKPDLSCGTSACALGWATTMPSFRRLGLRMRRDRDGDAFPCLVNSRRKSKESRIDQACRVLFGLTPEDTWFLFFPYDLRTPSVDGQLTGDVGAKTVANHIRRFVERKEAA